MDVTKFVISIFGGVVTRSLFCFSSRPKIFFLVKKYLHDPFSVVFLKKLELH